MHSLFFLPSGIFFPSKELRAKKREALMDFCLPLAGALCIWLSFLFHTGCKNPQNYISYFARISVIHVIKNSRDNGKSTT